MVTRVGSNLFGATASFGRAKNSTDVLLEVRVSRTVSDTKRNTEISYEKPMAAGSSLCAPIFVDTTDITSSIKWGLIFKCNCGVSVLSRYTRLHKIGNRKRAISRIRSNSVIGRW